MQKRILTILLIFALILTMSGGVISSALTVRAEELTYSNVLDDLQKDPSFNVTNYPNKIDDYSLHIIQVAEGCNGEIFVYVYQPSDSTVDLRAKKINMSLQNPLDEDASYQFYDLIWINSNGVFDKYVVNGVSVSSEPVRFYSIAAIYRNFDESLGDIHTGGIDDNTDYKSYSVATSWSCRTFNGNYEVKSNKFNVLDVDINSVGFFSFFDGFDFGYEYIDAHFVAFSVSNFNVDYISKAEITYEIVDYTGLGQSRENFSIVSYDEETRDQKHSILYDTDSSLIDAFWGAKSWDRIADITSFQKQCEENNVKYVDTSNETAINNAQFVFQFYETECRESLAMGTSTHQISGTLVSKVTLLSLTFISNNEVYHMGVVADVVSDDGSPDGEDGSDWDKLTDMFAKILGLFGLCAIGFLLYLCSPVIKDILKLIWSGIKAGFNFFISLITFPFRLIWKLLSGK